jgi:chromosome segregation protein
LRVDHNSAPIWSGKKRWERCCNLYLKRIEIKGFKSFADRVELEFDKGITGVVGPNGSGKSNISDAVRWVLGEQSAKSLRGSKMEDIIFAGTDSRKPLGFAEVSITIDNSDSMLPVEYTEVTVTRRMYRSGESEYYINKVGCRLKDITELFMDTGVGRDGYSIIGQGKIDEILSAKPEERREIFEEAAGIVKYKSRKQESEKKLDVTEQNITRLMDIINELEMQLEPLKDQSLKARQYLDMRERLKTLELNLFIRNVDRIKEKITAIDEQVSQLEDQLLENSRANVRIEEEYTQLKAQVQLIENTIEKIQNDIYSSNNDIERLQGEKNVLNERILNLQNTLGRLDEEIYRERQNISRLDETYLENKKTMDGIIGMLDEQVHTLESKSRQQDMINRELGDKDSYIENLKAEVIEILNLMADKKSSVNGYMSSKNNIEKRRNQINAEVDDKNEAMKGVQSGIKLIEEELALLSSKYNESSKMIGELETEKTSILSQKAANDKRRMELTNSMQTVQARYRVLDEMENEFEGYNRSVKEIMKLKDNSGKISRGLCGVVANLIEVEQKYETAIEVALGAALQNIVTEDEYTAKECIDFLKKNKLGRATFLPLSTVQGRNSFNKDSTLKNCRGYIGTGAELVKYESRYNNIISSLLGRVIIVDNLDNGIGAAKITNYSVKIVSLDGDVINPGGSFTGGSFSGKTNSILSRKRELNEMKLELQRLKRVFSDVEIQKDDLERKLNFTESQLKNAIEERHRVEIKISSTNSSFEQSRNELARSGSELANLRRELMLLEQEESETDKRIEDESRKLLELEQRSSEISASVKNEQSNLKEIIEKKDGISSEITAIKVKIAEYRQAVSSAQLRLDDLKHSVEGSNIAINSKLDEKLKYEEEIGKISLTVGESESSIKSIQMLRDDMQKQLESQYEEKKKNTLLLDGMEVKKKEYNEVSALVQGEIHKLEMQKAKQDMELESLQGRMWEEYEISYAAAVKYKIEIENMNQVSREINNMKESIKELGMVNVNAIEEYKKVKERFEFLTGQKEDLERAKDSLEKVIGEMTEKMRLQFAKNFSIINENFNSTFKQLFGGGRAELILCDEENVLISGVEIIAQPPGKKLQSLMLLSGGEKALTAIALLFAILKLKPSPFCILDEIEAALDDVNVARYARFLRDISDRSQFIIVTHRKGTMEISDSLYGVTMEEKGVSKLVSVRLSEKAS